MLITSYILTSIGLLLDILGVRKLFYIKEESISRVPEISFDEVEIDIKPEYDKEDINRIVNELSKTQREIVKHNSRLKQVVKNLTIRNQVMHTISKEGLKLIITGFLLQILAVVLQWIVLCSNT